MTTTSRHRFVGPFAAVLLALAGCGSADDSASSADGGPGEGGGGRPGGGDVPSELANAPTYDFGDATGPGLYEAAQGTYRVECSVARGPKTKVGPGYVVVEPGALTALNADGETVLALTVEGSAGGSALQAGGELAILTIVTHASEQIALNVALKTGELAAHIALPGQTGMMCHGFPGRTMKYGLPLPEEIRGLAGTHHTMFPNAPEYDVVFDDAGKVVVTETSGPEAGTVRHTAEWHGGDVPIFLQSGEFVLYDAGSTTHYRIQYASSVGTGGTDIQVHDGEFWRLEAGALIARVD